MPSRNERNAIIFAGTMGLIRKSVLEEIGGWDEWCITEDAEASLRILKLGYESLYIQKSYGKGLMPFDLEGLKKQRFRWCFGGIQLLKKHWESLMPWAHWIDPNNKLTIAQRYYYLVGGLGWFSDVFNLLFAGFLVLGAVFNLMSSPVQVRPLTNTVLIIPAVFLLLHIMRFLWVLRNRLRISLPLAFATMYNFFSLGWAVTLACIQGLVQREGVFLRTSKSNYALRAWRALQVTQWETAIAIICGLAGILSFGLQPNWRTFSLMMLLFWQGSLYLSGPLYSLLSLRTGAGQRPRGIEPGKPVMEELAARWVVVACMLLIAAFSLIALLPSPTGSPGYSRFLPVDLSIPQLLSGRSDSTTGTPVAEVTVQSANCRSRPFGNSEKVALLYRDQTAEIMGRNEDPNNPWWYIKIPNADDHCWLWGMTATTTGNVDELPIIR